MVDGDMTMQKQNQISIPAGGTLIFEPGGNHIVLIRLMDDLAIGNSFAFKLRLADGSEITLKVPAKGE